METHTKAKQVGILNVTKLSLIPFKEKVLSKRTKIFPLFVYLKNPTEPGSFHFHKLNVMLVRKQVEHVMWTNKHLFIFPDVSSKSQTNKPAQHSHFHHILKISWRKANQSLDHKADPVCSTKVSMRGRLYWDAEPHQQMEIQLLATASFRLLALFIVESNTLLSLLTATASFILW